jgi:hypothetical protein
MPSSDSDLEHPCRAARRVCAFRLTFPSLETAAINMKIKDYEDGAPLGL